MYTAWENGKSQVCSRGGVIKKKEQNRSIANAWNLELLIAGASIAGLDGGQVYSGGGDDRGGDLFSFFDCHIVVGKHSEP